jgi:hypothetical protein
MANWRDLLRPGGRLVVVDGFWFADWDDADVPALFAENYTADTRVAAFNGFKASGLFEGQSEAFFRFSRRLAREADAAQREIG